jgi:copper resistance protein B
MTSHPHWRRSALAACLLAATAASAQHEGHGTPAAPSTPAPMSRPGSAASQPDPARDATGTRSRADPNTPRPPENTSGPMSMPVSDDMVFHQVLIDQLEYTRTRHGGSGLAWDMHAWVGRDYNRLWLKWEGEREDGRTEDNRIELLWSRPVAAFWDLQAGVRHDVTEGARRNWLAVGVQGVAPYWFDVEATAYVGGSGRTAFRAAVEYTFVLAQRTFLAPELELNFHGKTDRARGVGSGLSDASFGVRLRHEVRREFAPYIGVNWNRRFGRTADLARAAGEPVRQFEWVAGVRAWF